jgi:ribose/xylose/arabinose/galactoside ABC-type transport system permease subunit
MSQPPYQVDQEDYSTLALLEPPGPPGYPAPPGIGQPPEGDRPLIHLIWEAFLFFVVLGLFVLTRSAAPDAFRGDELDLFLVKTAILGLIATGLAFSLRAAVPNLAVGLIAVLGGAATVELVAERNLSNAGASGFAVLGCAVVGLVLALVVVIFNVPAWAVTLGGAAVIGGVVFGWLGTDPVDVTGDFPDVLGRAWLLAGLFASLSVLGGMVWLFSGVRRRFGGRRQDADPAHRPQAGGVAGAVLALVVSSALAGGAGVLSLWQSSTVLEGLVGLPTSANALQSYEVVTYSAFAAVLLGGVSVFGRRAGVFGTVLGVLVIRLVEVWLDAENVNPAVFVGGIGGLIIVGLIVNRALEFAGRKPPAYY